MSDNATTHSLRRTSPMGEPFRGECVLCGMRDLTIAEVFRTECKNPDGTSRDQAVLDAIADRPASRG